MYFRVRLQVGLRIAVRKKAAKMEKKGKKKVVKKIDSTHIVYIILDMKTNGLNRHYNDIIELSATYVDNTGVVMPNEDTFHCRCRPMKSVGHTQKNHGISDDMLKDEELFDVVGPGFMEWLKETMPDGRSICMVAYNGNNFHFPFPQTCCERYAVNFFEKIK